MKKKYTVWIAWLLLAALLITACGAEDDTMNENTDGTQQSAVDTENDREDGDDADKKPSDDTDKEKDPDQGGTSEDDENPKDDSDIVPEDPDQIETISSQGSGYGDILRLKSTLEMMFSPAMTELRELVEIGENLEDYQAQLTFILLDEKGSEYYAYPEVVVPIHESNGDWFEIFLQAEDVDCGFCPTAGRVYTIEIALIKEERIVMQGTWQKITATEKYVSSPYYHPNDIPDAEEVKLVECTVQYLPQVGGVIEGESKQVLKAGQASSKVKAIATRGYMFSGWSDGVSEAEREGDTFIRDKIIYARFTKIEMDAAVPNMYIETETGNPIVTKDYQNATIRILGAAEEKYDIFVTTEIRGRGNSSFSGSAGQNDYNSKNSYRIKLSEKQNLLGIGGSANRDWVLNSNKFDASNLRNYFVWNLANQMQTMPFVPGCTWVNLYINGDYRGIYMLTDLVEVSGDRVDVDDASEEADKGFLVELDFRGADEKDVVEGLNYFYVPGFYDPASGIANPREWVIKSEITDVSQTEFIRNYIISCHAAIMGGNREEIDALIDIPSLVDMFILEELAKDVDAGGSSMFMQKDTGGKLYFTAPWDYDFGFGTYGPAIYTDGFVCEGSGYDPNIWFEALIGEKWFLAEVYARMQEVDGMIEIAKRAVVANGEMLEEAADRNDRRWNIYGSKFHSYVSGQVSRSLYSYDEHIDFLCEWIDERWDWMMNELAYRLK